ncbi:capsular exopolysaccharide synthesis family protein [Pedobacter sp. CAN_A7]|uniref:GumC family protein n=1 Tax=Pedobacter sp. CAN_A7 TaxID=2787722 RepID=UPI0018CB7468
MEDLFEDNTQQQGSNSFDFNHFLSKLKSNYIWIIMALLIALCSAFLYLRYSTYKYQISGYILVGGAELQTGANDILANAGLINSSDKKESAVSNEIFILKSNKINGQVVDSLQLDINVIRSGALKDQPILNETLPVDIKVKKHRPNKTSALYKLNLTNNKYIISEEGVQRTGNYGVPLIINQDTVIINRKPGKNISSEEYSLQFVSRLNTLKKYISQLTIQPVPNGGVGLLKISIIDEMPERANQYINVLIDTYNLSYIEYKSQAIRRALVFLGDRLKTVSSELSQQENQVKDFKADNKIYDVSATATELLGNLQTLDVQKGTNDYQDQLLGLVESSLKKASSDDEIVASANGIQDIVLAGQVAAYNELVFKKQMIKNSGTSEDPRLAPISEQLKDIKNSILKNIGNIKRQFAALDNNVRTQENKISNKFQSLPEKEKQFVELSRKLNIKESQYIFLLQKKEETEIQLVSSDGARSRTVDDILNEGLVDPIPSKVYAISALVGLLLPTLIIFLRVFLNQRIETRKEIENGTSVPILGELGISNSDQPIVISANNRTAIAEQLRAIRTNLSFISANEEQKVFLVTSTMSGEGKSFLSLNLGNSLAISNKKVAILELDLRKPMLSKNLGIHNKLGISSYLVQKTINPTDIIQPVENYPNLFLLNSGPIPPNPGELIINSRMEELMAYLNANFDYIILDLPPIGLVADALSMAKFADISLFVIRPNYSYRSSLRLVNDLYREKKFPKLSIVLNGIQPQQGYGYGYGYGYGGYYAEENPESDTFVKRMLKKININS